MNYTVVIPFFNNNREVGIAIDSILSQSVPPKQIYVVNDCSSGEASRLLELLVSEKNCGLITVIYHHTNQGVSNARNTGIEASLFLGVDFIAFCDADDAWDLHKMRLQLSLFCHPNVLAVSCALKENSYPARMQPHQVYSLTLRDLLRRNYVQPSTLVVRASALRLLGSFPPGRRYAEEGDLYNRIAETGTILFLSSPLVYYDTRPSVLAESHSSNERSPRRLSHSIILMYLGNFLNLYACHRRGSLSMPALFIYSFFLFARLTARCLFILQSRVSSLLA
jgi:glycosyltransferase involved in cell wall biosynthesis